MAKARPDVGAADAGPLFAPPETDAFALLDGRGRVISASEGLSAVLNCDTPSDRLTGRAFDALLQMAVARPDVIEADLWLTAVRQNAGSGRMHQSGELRLRGPGAEGDVLILNAQCASGVRMFVRIRRRAAPTHAEAEAGAPPARAAQPAAEPSPGSAASTPAADTPAGGRSSRPGLGPVLEGLPDAVFVTDMSGRLILGNDPCRDIFSRPLAPLIGQPVAALLPRDLSAAMAEADAAVAETGQPLRFTRARNVALGHWREYEIVKAPLRSPEGLQLGIVTTCRDVTVQDAQIRQGMEQARLLDALLTHIPYFVTWKNRDLVYQGCSQNFADIFASGSRNGVIGATDNDLLPLAGEAETFRRGDTAVMTTGTPLLDVHRIVHRPDGRSMRWMISTVCLRDRNGQITGILSVARDVTAARRTEAERDRLSRIMQSLLQLPVTVFQTDDTGTITEAFGETVFEGSDTKGKDVFRLLPGAAGALRDSLTRRRTVRFEVTDDRRNRALDVVFGPDRPGGRGYLGVGLDVTERRRAERALRERDQLLSSIIGTIPVMMSAVEPDGRIVFSEGRALSLLGHQSGETVGRTAAQVWSGQPRVLEALDRAHRGQEVVLDLEVGESALQMHIMPMGEDEDDHAANGRRRGSVGPALILGVDITDRRRAEARFRAMFEKATVGLALLNDSGAIVTANGALCRILGEEADALAGRRAGDLLPVPEPGTWRSWREVVGGRAVGAPAPPWLRIGHHAFSDGRGEEAASILMVEDSSEVRELEDQLAHLSKLTALGEMAASLAHEINQPLNTARLVAEAALEDLAGSRAKSARRGEKALSTIHAQTQRIAEIIRHVRQFGRRDDDKPRPFDPVAVTRTVVKFFRHEARKAKVALNVDLPRTGPLVLGHTVRFEQVLINLLRNALDAVVEAHGESGEGRIELSIRLEDKTAVVCVRDNGPGIPDGVRDRIFEPFFTTKSAERGSGLGLAICLTIVAEMNGRLDVLRPDTGAAIAIRLPVPEPPALAAGPAIPAAALRQDDSAAPVSLAAAPKAPPMARGPGGRRSTKALAGFTVVVADDEEEALQTVARSLRGHGMSVITAGTGEEAFDAVVEHDPDAVITDLTMPGAGGEAFIERLGAGEPGLPVIVMTGRPVRDEPWRRHVAAVLGKPVGLKELRELLKDLLLTRH
ncbi:hypothetical protein C882_0016 [Caenispirillum salinarum AK4]|uniref:histidine kinase n=1 Tax=Caenispirillum salinarum AK4 TaxID=1238182 RepID=K9HRK8_9PROT|nr:PAS domain-containing protein [Caenispirillum salinarum]EKV32933.1 hypothetical protein C882_0016 [Caenispirillum salinarum AK4]